MMRRGLAALARRLRPRRTRPRILMYHRVADLACDPWGLAVHPERFAEQLEMLARRRTPLPMDAFVARLRAGTLPRDAVAVTFDDGYADNLHNARPALAAAGVPATLFVATAAIGSPHGFWWDELAQLILLREAPLAATVELPGGALALRLGPREPADADRTWRAWEPPRTDRQRDYRMAWGRLKALAPQPQAEALEAVRAACGHPAAAHPDDRAMTEAELRALAAGGLVTLGGHTAHHPALPTLPPDMQQAEILQGRQAIADLTGTPPAGFAYPYGAMCGPSRAAVARCGFAWACTTDANAPMHRNSDPFALPRLAVADVGGAAFRRTLG